MNPLSSTFSRTHQTIPLPRIAAPPMARVRQEFLRDAIAHPDEEIRRQLQGYQIQEKIGPGDRVAITGSSRGMGGFIPMLKGIVRAIKECGGEPFIVPAMGSHGGAFAGAQLDILMHLGVTEDAIGAPIRATMDTVVLGSAENGAVAHLDSIAASAEGIIVFERVKIHPESVGDFGSGLLKCVTIGLGKQRGAQEAHSHGLWDSVRSVAKITMNEAKILCGVAVVENAYQEPVHIEVVPPVYEAFLETDIRLLRKANKYFPKIPFNDLDLLIVDQIGKNISGAGIDPNVVGKWRISGGPHIPDYRRIVILSLTPESLGNGIGIGFGDFTTERFMKEFDQMVTYVNLLTASEPGGNTREGVVPLVLPSDRDAIEVGIYSALPKGPARVCRIKNTEELAEFWVSEALVEEARKLPTLQIVDPPAPMTFDESGNLY